MMFVFPRKFRMSLFLLVKRLKTQEEKKTETKFTSICFLFPCFVVSSYFFWVELINNLILLISDHFRFCYVGFVVLNRRNSCGMCEYNFSADSFDIGTTSSLYIIQETSFAVIIIMIIIIMAITIKSIENNSQKTFYEQWIRNCSLY